ncbi:MAG: hypothetical protein V4639_00295 [Pseudomonadota bacterium]
MIPRLLTGLLLAALTACGTPPRASETVWVTVSEVFTPQTLAQDWNRQARDYAGAAGLSDADVAAGRVLKLACGLGADHAWASYGHVPPGMQVARNQVVILKVDDPGNDDRMGWNPVLGRVQGFNHPGSLAAYNFIADWRERGLRSNLEPVPLQTGQHGRYVISHSNYLIKCRQ